MKPALVVGFALSLALSGGKVSPPLNNSANKTFTIKSYNLYSEDSRELNQALKMFGPKDQFGGDHHAYSKWDISWNWPSKEGKQIYKEAAVNVDVTLTLPTWLNIKTNQDLYIWNKYATAVVAHEMNHWKAAYQAGDDILRTIQSFSENTEAKVVKMHIHSRLDQLRGFDVSYDHRTQHGQLEGVTLNAGNQNKLNSLFSVLSSPSWMEPK